ncbi:DUF4407 domain-containing protein [Nocardia sp. NPDC057353]|uniref:DUF4407 domain-containing protein n=1 Tax=Nocardia sp. NPDC057353 TaxID=3346104 RepID=UPI00363CBF0E
MTADDRPSGLRSMWVRLLLWPTGVDRAELDDGHGRRRYLAAGALVYLTALAAFAAMTIAQVVIFGPFHPGYLIASTVWALIVLSIDVWITSTIDYGRLEPDQKQARGAKFLAFFGRLVMSAVIGILIAEPILLLAFDQEVRVAVEKIHSREAGEVAERVTGRAEFTRRKEDLERAFGVGVPRDPASAIARYDAAKDKKDKAFAAWQCEHAGTCGTMAAGYGTEERRLYGVFENALTELAAEEQALAAAEITYNTGKAQLDRDIQEAVVDETATIDDNWGLLIREQALHEVESESSRAMMAAWLLRAALMLVDLMPLLIKTFSSRTPYEQRVRARTITDYFGIETQAREQAEHRMTLIRRGHALDLADADHQRRITDAVASAMAKAASNAAVKQVGGADIEGLIRDHLGDALIRLSPEAPSGVRVARRSGKPAVTSRGGHHRRSGGPEAPTIHPDRLRAPAPPFRTDPGRDPGPRTAPFPFLLGDRWLVESTLDARDRRRRSDATLYLARDNSGEFDGEFVVKLLHNVVDAEGNPMGAARKEAEFRGIENEHWAPIYDAKADRTGFFVVTRRYPDTLLGLAQRRPLTLAETWRFADQLLRGLIAAWAIPRIHLDIKPSNIAIDEEGVVKIFDWGISKDPDTSTGDTSGGPSYTTHYAPPEQIARAGNWVHENADLRAFAATWYWMLTGVPPLQAEALEARVVTPTGRIDNESGYIAFLRTARPRPAGVLVPGIPGELGQALSQWLDPVPENRNPGDRASYAERLLGRMHRIGEAIRDSETDGMRVGAAKSEHLNDGASDDSPPYRGSEPTVLVPGEQPTYRTRLSHSDFDGPTTLSRRNR